MTTVIYDGTFLASDSRSTSPNMQHECPKCQHESERFTNKAKKINAAFPHAKFRGERIIGVGQAGVASFSQKLVSALLRENGDLEATYKSYKSLLTQSSVPESTLIIVTTNSVFRVESDNAHSDELVVKRFELTDVVAAGSGGKAAHMAVSSFGMNAMEAIAEVCKYDQYSGGPIKYIGCASVVTDARAEVHEFKPREKAPVAENIPVPVAKKVTKAPAPDVVKRPRGRPRTVATPTPVVKNARKTK